MNLKRGDWIGFALWGAGLTVALVFLAWVMRDAAVEQLQRDTEQSARNWAQLAGATVPDLEAVFERRGLSAEALGQLKRLRHASQVFRFKLFDRQGVQILGSDDLDRVELDGKQGLKLPPPPPALATHAAPPSVLRGASYIVLKRQNRPDLPAVYSEAYVPVLRDGRVLGVVEVYVDQVERAASADLAFARVAGSVAALLMLLMAVAGAQLWRRQRQQRRAEAHMSYLAHHDVLSGVLNRTSFHEALQHAGWRRKEGGPGFALLRIDLDDFKDVADSMGHAAADEVLRQTAHRLSQTVRHGDHVARLGGGELAILQTGVSSSTDVSTLAERIVTALATPYDVTGGRVHCAGKVGAAIHGVDATEDEDLLRKADLALYRAKSAGRSPFSFYDATMDEQFQARRMLTHDLRDAIGSDQISLAYQPLYANGGKTLTGYEALLRWQHPVRGNVGTAEFIPLAEEAGLIDVLGRWVLQRACIDAASWPSTLSVAVNLSAAQFRHGDLVVVVAGALKASGLAADRLELEITESLMMRNTEQILDTLHALSAMGIRIAMDDFGTGYSSLAYLWRFPFDKVKIARAFTQNLGSDPKVNLIVRSIISLAHSLDIRVNAGGVETPSQMAALQQHGCDELQGFLLGRPSPVKGLPHEHGVVALGPRSRRSEQRHSMWRTPPVVPLPSRPVPLV
jgi:diguanylate cyclase (GGDEF)-like protein